MSRPNIKTLLIATFVTVGLLFAGLAVAAFTGLANSNANTETIALKSLPGVHMAQQVAINMADVRVAIRDHMIAETPAEMAEVEAKLATMIDKFKQSLNAYRQYADTDALRDGLAKVETSSVTYLDAIDATVVADRTNDPAQIKPAKDKLAVQRKNVSESIDALANLNVDASNKAYQDSQSSYASTLLLVQILTGFAAIILLAAIVFALTGIARPIDAITKAMLKLASGDTKSIIPFSGRSDEIGAMAGAVEVFRQAAITNITLQDEAETNRRQAEANRIADQQRAEAEAAERMRVATSGLAAGLKRLAAGDLSFQLNDAFAADFEGLRQDFNTSILQLANTLTSVARSVGNITSGSQEISSGATDLSKRTEQQAAALEETAAALDQITANVTSSSKRAEEARKVATDANDSAKTSGDVVGQAVNAMSRIEESSKQISNIIGVIDEIAFQTNLLALNAGVEAARAGDAGKGFAVVAQEVRELAQRSASAAKEIKGLIQASTTEVASGVALVSQTGTALRSIGDFIVTINQHMEAIATSSREQSVGLAEVNTAVNQMDQTTQQNAAMVEESSAAAGTLANEANALRQLISQFELGQSGPASNPVHALQQTASRMASPARPTPARAAARPVSHGNAAVAKDWSEF